MNLIKKILALFRRYPEHLKTGIRGEKEAKRFLISRGLKFLTANYNSGRGEIDLIFRDGDCLVFVEVQNTRSSEEWTRPSKALIDGNSDSYLLRL
jgi:putative endonuclease